MRYEAGDGNVTPRGQGGEVAVFVSNHLTRQHTTQEGIYIVVRSRDYGAAHGPPYSLLVTMHGNKKKKFDNDTYVMLH